MWLCPWYLETVEKSLRQHEHWFLCSQPSLSTGLRVLVLLLYYHYATMHPHKMLINHRSNPVTFALFKKKLQTLAFRKYNYLPLHISAALWAVYLTVFDYRLTFVLYFYCCQIELGWWEGTHGLCFLWCCHWNSAISKYEQTLRSFSHRACHFQLMQWNHSLVLRSLVYIFLLSSGDVGLLSSLICILPNLCMTVFCIIFLNYATGCDWNWKRRCCFQETVRAVWSNV